MTQRAVIPNLHRGLLPFAWLYAAGVKLRNTLFDRKILPVEECPVPLLSVGNINVGGTGKTPHIEFLVELLSPHCRVAVLSRGYRRKSCGFLLATPSVTAEEIGDEPYQIYRKYPQVTVAVDANRRRGIRCLLQSEEPPQVILLDDAFQHRYVKPSFSIVLCDYNRPVYADLPLPAGRLREPVASLQRADAVILTKCPRRLTADELMAEAERLHYDSSRLYTSALRYGDLMHFSTHRAISIEEIPAESRIIVFTAIANPSPLIAYLAGTHSHVTAVSYPDHHDFTSRELSQLAAQVTDATEPVYIITTEKDAARLYGKTLPAVLSRHLYIMPLAIELHPNIDGELLEQRILEQIK